MRVLEAQLTLAARAIGSLFIPALQAILPPAIAVVQVITELINVLASFVGFEMPKISWGDSSDLSNVSGELDNVASGAAAAKKEINYLIGGFDELNVMNKDTGSSGGGGSQLGNLLDGIELPQYDMFKDYVGNQVDEFVDKFRNAAKKITNFLKPITPILKGIGTAVATAFVAKKVSDFFKQFKTGNKLLGVASTAFDSIFHAFRTGSTATEKIANGFKSLWGNFSGFLQSLPPVAQFAVSVGALATEFVTLKNATEEYMLGNISLTSAVTQSGLVFTAVTATLTAMLGPFGAALSVITGLVSILYGAIDAQHQLNAAMTESLMYNNGGVPVQQVADAFSHYTQEIRNNLSAITEQSEAFENNQKSIEGITTQINKWQSEMSMDSSMIVEDLGKISDSFDDLQQSITSNLEIAAETLKLFAANNQSTFESLGLDVENFTEQVNEALGINIEGYEDLFVNLQQVTALYKADPFNLEYQKQYEEQMTRLFELLGINLNTSADLSEQLNFEGVDFTSLDDLEAALAQIPSATETTITELENTRNQLLTFADSFNAFSPEIAENLKSTINTFFDWQVADVSAQAQATVDWLQSQYNSMVAQAMGGVEISQESADATMTKLMLGLGSGNASNDAAVIAGLKMSQYTVEGAEKAFADTQKELDEIFAESASDGVTAFAEQIKSQKTYDSVKTSGQYLAEGIGEGLKEAGIGESKDFVNQFTDSLKEFFGIHSPSTVMNEQVGQYLGQGIIEGMKQSLSILPTEIAAILNNLVENTVKPQFAIDKWTTIFNNVNVAAKQKTTEAINEWKTSVQNWINKDVKSTFEEKVWSEHYEGMKTAFQKINEENLKDFNEFSKNLTNGVKNLISDLQDYADRHPIIIEIKTVRTGSSYGDSDDGEYSSRSRSRSVPALASGGVISSPSLVLTGEYNGVRNNPEIVSPQNIMRDTMEEANTGVISALYQLISIAEEIANKDTTIQLDGDEVGRSLDRRSRNKGFDLGVEY